MRSLSLVIFTFLSSTLVHAANHFAGLVAANAIGGRAPYTCRTQDQWNNIARQARDNGFKSLRVVGFDCDGLHRATRAAVSHGLTVLAGIYIPGTIAANMRTINNEVQVFRQAYHQYGAAQFAGLTIGNEVNDSVGNIMAKVYDVRGYLRSVGVNTPVSTVHTWVRIRDQPALCGADFVAANAHTYFDGNRKASQTGDFIFGLVVPELRRRCPGKKVVITESGWPSRGSRNGQAVPSLSDQKVSLSKLNCAAKKDKSVQVYAFEADDQVWKHNEVEKSFGLFGGKMNVQNDVLREC